MKHLKESIYRSAVVSFLAMGYTMLGKTLIRMSPPSLGKFDVSKISGNCSTIRFH